MKNPSEDAPKLRGLYIWATGRDHFQAVMPPSTASLFFVLSVFRTIKKYHFHEAFNSLFTLTLVYIFKLFFCMP